MLKFKPSWAVLAYLSSNLLNEVGLSLFRYFEVGLRVCDIVVNKFTFAISSPEEFLCINIVMPSRSVVSERGTYVHVRYMLSAVRLSVVCLSSVTLVHPTQPVELFGNFFSPYASTGTLVF